MVENRSRTSFTCAACQIPLLGVVMPASLKLSAIWRREGGTGLLGSIRRWIFTARVRGRISQYNGTNCLPFLSRPPRLRAPLGIRLGLRYRSRPQDAAKSRAAFRLCRHVLVQQEPGSSMHHRLQTVFSYACRNDQCRSANADEAAELPYHFEA